jgi:hypothetical protein
MSRNYTIINYFLNNKNSYKSHMVFPYPYGSILIPVPLLSFPWVFFCLINAYASDGQPKEPQQQQQWEQQRGEQPGCQPAATPSAYS